MDTYEKKYKDAMERMKLCVRSGLKITPEYIFTELAESEDEKVRKELIKHLKELSDWKEDEVIPVKNPSYYRQWASWLEKQGGYANFRNKAQVGDRITKNEAGVLVNLSQLKRVAKPNEEQGEQKASCTSIVETGNGGINALVTRELPTEMKSAEESLGIDSDTYNKIVDECIFGEQKAEENKGNIGGISLNWSEEDERMFNSCCAAVAAADYYTLDDKQDIEIWLQSLKGRVKPQPKQEWSEEDSFRTETLISVIKSGGSIRPELRNEFINWLKSLRPQNRWKPSELQLGCLSDAIEHYNSLGYPAPKLKELLDDLKKLKEE